MGESLCASVLLGNHMMHMKRLAIVQGLVTDRTQPLLPLGQLPLATGRAMGLRPTLSPIVLEGRVVRGIRGAN
jgi:hypothetical protein